MNKTQILRLKMLFVESKRLYNFAISFMTGHDINDFDSINLPQFGATYRYYLAVTTYQREVSRKSISMKLV